METFIQPINLSTETTGAIQPREMAHPAENFAEALKNHYLKGGDKELDSNDMPVDNPDPSLMASLPSALIASDLPALPNENGNSSLPSGVSPTGTPSSGPSPLDPSGKLTPLPSIFELYSGDPMALLYLENRLVALQPQSPQEVNPKPLTPPSAIGQGEPEKWVPSTLGEPIRSLHKESLNTSLPSNAFNGKIEAILQDGSVASKVSEEVPLQKSSDAFNGKIEAILQDGSIASKFLEKGLVPNEGDRRMSSASELGPRGGESINPLLGEEKIPPQKDSSPILPASSPRNGNPNPFNLDGVKLEGAERTPFPKIGPQDLGGNPNQTPHENSSLPESPTQIPPLFAKGSGASFSEGGGRGQEKILFGKNGPGELAERAVQNRLDYFGITPEGREDSSRMGEKLGEVKENYSPTPLKSENQTVSQQISQRVIWLIRNNEESVRITLDPPQLGHIYMEINRNKENIKTTLWTDNPATKATLETNQLQIQKIIENEGFKLEKFDVFVQQEMGRFQGPKDDPMNPNPRSPVPSSEIRAPLSDSPDPLPTVARALHPASKYLDLFV